MTAVAGDYIVPAIANASDYTGATPGAGKTITFLAGSSTATLVLDPTADTAFEANETITLTLVSSSDYIVGTTAPTTGSIYDDDLYSISLIKAVSPQNLTATGNSVYFTTYDAVYGVELWKSDGTQAGTTLVKDINPGSNGSSPHYLTAVGNTLYFTADDGVYRYELWKSDGTQAGTTLVKDINPGQGWSVLFNLTALGNTLYFTADDGVHGYELWKSDGTQAGTTLVKDINPGLGYSYPLNLTAVGNTLYFSASDGVTGWSELWKSDGTEAGTTLVKDINPGQGWSVLSNLTALGNTLYFTADDGVHGYELWKSDGTEAGTTLVKDINPGSGGSFPYSLTAVGNTLYFAADDGVNGYELWKSDGTEAGTTLLRVNNVTSSGGSYPLYLTALRNTLYFRANDGVNGYELWKSDGTQAGTTLVKDLNPGSGGSFPYNLTAVGNTLYFTADDGVYGYELWKSDGTQAGTTLLRDLNPGSGGSINWGPILTGQSLVVVGNTLYFTANDGLTGDALYALNLTEIPSVTMAVSPASVTEDGTTNLVYTFTRTGINTNPLTVNYTIAGTADGSDYSGATPGAGKTITFLAGSSTATLVLDPTADTIFEADETVALTLVSSSDYTVGTPGAAIGTIANDDPAPTVRVLDASIPEGNSGSTNLTFLVALSAPSSQLVTIDYATANNTATAGSDYTSTSGTLTIQLGATSGVVRVPILGDSTAESDETFFLNITNATGGVTIADGQGIGTIINDDGVAGLVLIGTPGRDTLTGSTTNDSLTGLAGADNLDGQGGADTFVYNALTDSLFGGRDTLRSFKPSEGDRIDLPTVPAAVFYVGSVASSISAAALNTAYAAADSNTGLAAHEAVFFATGSGRTQRLYLSVNDGTAAFNVNSDLVMEVTGMTGAPSVVGALTVADYFI